MQEHTAKVLSVRELTFYLKHLLERDAVLNHAQVAGEVSNLKYHSSGHVYFSIKDAEAQLTCVMFRSAARLAPRIQEGDQVVLSGGLTIYPPRGNYQFLVQSLRKAGLGDLYQRFLALKEKLREEGLFEPQHKQVPPAMPRTVALITSPTGAAVRDMIQTLRRRFDKLRIIVIPTVVQGERGAASIIHSLEAAQTCGADVILLGRGGGSIEDLWNFNEEAVARAVFASRIPVISGIGHETDTTIVDFVADVRASTPTAAAERAVPDKQALLNGIAQYETRLLQSLQHFIDFKRQVVDDYENRLEQGFWLTLERKRQTVTEYNQQLDQAFRQLMERKRHELDLLEARLLGMDRSQLLDQGYTLTLKNGEIIKGKKGLKTGDQIETVFADGRISSEITAT